MVLGLKLLERSVMERCVLYLVNCSPFAEDGVAQDFVVLVPDGRLEGSEQCFL